MLHPTKQLTNVHGMHATPREQVLNFLRDGWCSLPRFSEERRELLQEIRYYQVSAIDVT
jgi:hypothetical protein